MTRPTREQLHMRTAVLWSLRSKCLREGGQVGALITDLSMQQILSFGYNGRARGLIAPCRNEPGNCGCVHAEANAIAKADGTLRDKVMFCTCAPCEACASLMVNSHIGKLFYINPYRTMDGLNVLLACGVEVKRMEEKAIVVW